MASKKVSDGHVGRTESQEVTPWCEHDPLTSTSRDETSALFKGLEIGEEKDILVAERIVETDLKDNSNRPEQPDDEESSDDEIEIDIEEKYPLSQSMFIYPNKPLTQHGHVLEGEIISDVTDPRPCAIKISEQGDKEARILQKLGTHTHVITLIQSGAFQSSLNEKTYLALERCHELNLRQYLFGHRVNEVDYDDKWSLNICKQLINGLKFIHDNFVIHKDLKPSNILLTHDLRSVKIADLGSSQELKSTSSKVFCRNMFGTLGYRPPESFGGSYASLKSDTYSLGVVMYFILSCGESPFGPNKDLWDHNVTEGIIELGRLRVENLEPTEHLIKSMLNHERCSRPSIWQVERHPCWSGEDMDCVYDYGFEEEIDDCDVIEDKPGEPLDLEEMRVRERQAMRIIEKIIPKPTETFLIFFDQLTSHLMCFNPRNNFVKEIHEMNDDMKKNFYAPVALGDHIYVLMDNRHFYRVNYRQSKTVWQQMADVIFDHGWFPLSVVAGGKIYVVSGTYTKAVSRFDPKLQRWEQVTNKNLAARDAAITATDQHVYCLGGWIDGVGASNRVERLDVKTLIWDEIQPMLQARYYSTALECETNLFAFGGRSRTIKLNTVEMYNSKTDQWAAIKPMTQARAGSWFRCHYIAGCILAINGDYGETIEKYDFKEDCWKKVEIDGPKMDIYCSVVVGMKSYTDKIKGNILHVVDGAKKESQEDIEDIFHQQRGGFITQSEYQHIRMHSVCTVRSVRSKVLGEPDTGGEELREDTSTSMQAGKRQDCFFNSEGNFVSRWECNTTVGPAGGVVELGGCWVDFQHGTFDVEREITVTTDVDSTKWPEDDEVISPIFYVDMGRIKKPATVHLMTWVVPDDEIVVDIMHSSHEIQDQRSWEQIATCHFSDQNFIEFECSNFSGFFARISKIFSKPVKFSLLPSLYVFKKHFVVALHLDNEVIRESFAKHLEKTFHQQATISKSSMSQDAAKGDEIPIGVSCSRPEIGFEFDPTGNYNCSIDKKIRKGNVFHKQCVIYSELKEARNIVIYFKCNSKIPDAICYRWVSDLETSLRTLIISDTAGKHSSSATDSNRLINVNVTVHDDHSTSETAGIKNVGGTINKTVHDSTTHIAGTSKNT